MDVEIIEKTTDKIVFSVQTQCAGACFMRYDYHRHAIIEKAIIFVSGTKLLKLWHDCPVTQPQDSIYGEKHIWESDYKYQSAAEGFNKGRQNPVPLALICCDKDQNNKTSIGFTDGMTRTMWLLSKETPCFPVEADKTSAKLIYDQIGFKGTDIIYFDKN